MQKKYLTLLGILIIPASLSAHQLNEYTISGYVTDITSGAKQVGVTVEVINEADSTQQSKAVTDTSGWYTLSLMTYHRHHLC